jgi:hypothetical protein
MILAYPENNMSRQMAGTYASDIARRPHVRAAIELAEAAIEKDRRKAGRNSAQAIVLKYWSIIEKDGVSEKDQIAALKGLTALLPKGAIDADPSDDSVNSKQAKLDELSELLADNLPHLIEVDALVGNDEDVRDGVLEIVAVVVDDGESDY